jgi:hypothetical protein
VGDVGVEVAPGGEGVRVNLEKGTYLHITNAALGPKAKPGRNVLQVEADEKVKFALATLNQVSLEASRNPGIGGHVWSGKNPVEVLFFRIL